MGGSEKRRLRILAEPYWAPRPCEARGGLFPDHHAPTRFCVRFGSCLLEIAQTLVFSLEIGCMSSCALLRAKISETHREARATRIV